MNYAIHPEVLGSGQGVLRPDLIGPRYDHIKRTAGGIALFMNAAQGGMVQRAYWRDSRTWAESERIGGLLAAGFLRIVEPAVWQPNPIVKNASTLVRFPVGTAEIWQVVQFSPLQYPHRPGAVNTILCSASATTPSVTS